MSIEHDIQNLINRVTELEDIVETQQAEYDTKIEALESTVEELHKQIANVNHVFRHYAQSTNTAMQKMTEAIRGDVEIADTELKGIPTRKPLIKSIEFNNAKVSYEP